MFISDQWKDYELIDCSYGERLEKWGNVILIRPDPQAIFGCERENELWNKAHARYIRSSSGGGNWEYYKKFSDFTISYKDLFFHIRPTGFKHTGLFPEQATNWDWAADLIKNAGKEIRVLNMFAYTGAASVACAKAGASVTHVDASKGMVQWAKDNAALSGLQDAPIRYIVDDCLKFVEREIRRGSKYEAIIMDPPSYGRGPGGEVWKLEDKLYELVRLTMELMSDGALFYLINSYTTGFSAGVLRFIGDRLIIPHLGGSAQAGELYLPVTQGGFLPCGASLRWQTV